MEAKDFVAWLEHMGLNDLAASKALGISRTSVQKYKTEAAPPVIGLACAALAFGLPPWRKL